MKTMNVLVAYGSKHGATKGIAERIAERLRAEGQQAAAQYFNLTADPRAWVEIGGRRLAVRAEELPAEEAAAFWPRVLQVAPDYARYPRRTSRRIPLLRLVPATPATASDTTSSSVGHDPARRGPDPNYGER
jgi:hypothetical protein